MDLRNGYYLLRAREGQKLAVPASHGRAILLYASLAGAEDTSGLDPENIQVERWAGLSLPNGQRARTSWKEGAKPEKDDNFIRRYVQVSPLV